jgi:hypothetical protein
VATRERDAHLSQKERESKCIEKFVVIWTLF